MIDFNNMDFENLAFLTDLLDDIDNLKKEGKSKEEIEQYISLKKLSKEFNAKYCIKDKKKE